MKLQSLKVLPLCGKIEREFIHASISFRNLEANDYVTLYLLDDVVYEIEKQ